MTFTSGSTVKSFVSLLDPAQIEGIAGRVVVACIGPVTADAARAAGLPVDALAKEATIPGLADALEEYFAKFPRTPFAKGGVRGFDGYRPRIMRIDNEDAVNSPHKGERPCTFPSTARGGCAAPKPCAG